MKRKYVALMLGVTLAFSSMTVYAEDNIDKAVATATEEMELSEEEEALYGEITELEEDSITIALGMISVEEQAEQTEQAEQNEEVTSDQEVTEEIVSVTEETLFYREVTLPMPEELPEIVEETDAEENEAKEIDVAETDAEENVSEEDVAKDNSEMSSKEFLVEITEIELEEIVFEDLAEGDIVKIVLDEEGNAETVTVISLDEEMLQEEVPEENELIMTLEEVETDLAITEE